jgi:hypothetical protein
MSMKRLLLASGLVACGAASHPVAAPTSRPTGNPLTQAELVKGMEGVRPDVLRCYQDALKDRPTLAGTVTVTVEIATSGKVTGATAEGLGDARVETCAAAAAEAASFRSSSGETEFRFPYRLQPADPTKKVLTVSGGAVGDSDPAWDDSAARERSTAAVALADCVGHAVAPASGEIKIAFSVGQRGAVSNVTVTGPGDDALHACFAEAIKASSFLEPSSFRPRPVEWIVTVP